MWWPAPWGGWSWFQDVSRFQLSSLIDRWVSSWWPRLCSGGSRWSCTMDTSRTHRGFLCTSTPISFPRDSMSAESEACKHEVGSWTWSQCMNKISQNMDQRVIRGNCIEIYWRVETCPVGQDIVRIGRTPQKFVPRRFIRTWTVLEQRRWGLNSEISLCHCIALYCIRFEFCRPCGWHCPMARSLILFEHEHVWNERNTMKCAETLWIGKDLAEDCWKSTLVWVPTRSYVYVAKSKTSYTTTLQCFARFMCVPFPMDLDVRISSFRMSRRCLALLYLLDSWISVPFMERYLTDSEYYLNLKGIGLSRVGEARELNTFPSRIFSHSDLSTVYVNITCIYI